MVCLLSGCGAHPADSTTPQPPAECLPTDLATTTASLPVDVVDAWGALAPVAARWDAPPRYAPLLAGRALVAADVSGDGFDDLVIGLAGSQPPAGGFVIASGQGALSTIFERSLVVADVPADHAGLGSQLAADGDVSGDGRVDLLVSGTGQGGPSQTAVLLNQIPDAGWTPVASWAVLPSRLVPPDVHDRLESAVVLPERSGRARVAAVWSRSDGTWELGRFAPGQGGLLDRTTADEILPLGAPVSGAILAADLDATGDPLLIATDDAGSGLLLIDPTTAGVRVGWRGPSDSAAVVHAVEDVDEDGYADVLAGAHTSAFGGPSGAGFGSVLFGPSPRAPGCLTEGLLALGATELDWMGADIQAADLDQDGHVDLVVGAPSSPFASDRPGRIQVYFGPHGGPGILGDPDLVLRAPDGAGNFGWAIQAADMDRSGWLELAVSAPYLEHPSGGVGSVYLISGEALEGL